MAKELSLVLIKPDGVELSLTSEVLSSIDKEEDILLVGAKVISVSYNLAYQHYFEHRNKSFFNAAVNYLMGKYHKFPWVYAFVFYGEDVCSKIRKIAGKTNPMDKEGYNKIITIRQKYGKNVTVKDDHGSEIIEGGHVIVRYENVIHASESQSAEYEVKLWFEPEEILKNYRLYNYKELILKDEKGNEYKKLIWEKPAQIIRKELFGE